MIFRTIIELRVGGPCKEELLKNLELESISLNHYARVLFGESDFTTSAKPRGVRLAAISLPEIGLSEGATYADILVRAASVGLEPCALETGPHLRLNYLDQPEGPYLTVASVLLRTDESLPNGFYLRRLADGLWLRGYASGPENLYAPDFSDFVFEYPER